ncbi:hypothetical protein Tco_0565284 [Tanacetum coccineum]
MKHINPKTHDSLNKSVSGTITISETEPTTPSFTTEVKDTEQESKINELTKLVQMLIDEKVNSTQKTQESSSQIQQTESSKILYCMICKRGDHRTSDHEMYTASLKRSDNYKAQPYQYASPSKGGVLVESSQSSESSIDVKCNTCGSIVHSTTDHNEFDHFKRGLINQGVAAAMAEAEASRVRNGYDSNGF